MLRLSIILYPLWSFNTAFYNSRGDKRLGEFLRLSFISAGAVYIYTHIPGVCADDPIPGPESKLSPREAQLNLLLYCGNFSLSAGVIASAYCDVTQKVC
jgi:hypothetical protein